MFIPVACLKCGKMFQAPEAAAGIELECPWCKSTTPALPVAGLPKPESAVVEILSLDDESPHPPQTKACPRTPAKKRSPIYYIATGLPLFVIVLGMTIVVLRYGSGYISPIAWSEFTPPDGSCSIMLPGAPSAERIEPTPADSITRGLDLYTTSGWYSGTKVWFGWRDLDSGWVKVAKEDKSGAMITPVLAAERDKRKSQVHGTILTEATVRLNAHLGLQVEMETSKGRLVEWYVMTLEGPRPRLYMMGLEAKNAAADSAAAKKLFESFRLNN